MFLLRHFVCMGLLVAAILGCKESPPGNVPGGPTAGVSSLALTLSSPHQVDSDSFPNSDDVTVTARLLDSANAPRKSELVKLASTLGTLSSELVLTDAQGYATAKINSSDTLGAGTVTASFDTISAKKNFELLAPLSPSSVAAAKISVSVLRGGLSINRFKSNEVVQLRALIVDADNAPVPNQIVKFSTELGALDVETGLTDQNGAAQVNLSASDASLGASAALATAVINGVNLSANVNYEIIDSSLTITNQVVKLGYFDNTNTFVENHLGISLVPAANGDINISAGGTLGISLALVDENNARIMQPTQVSFGSSCVENKRAKIGTNIATINGVAVTTYEDVSCGGGQDVIQATVTVNNQTKTLVQTINISPENIGSIEFVSSSPDSIVLKGTGGQGLQETSTLTFLVKGALGNPLAQQPVSFSLNTSAGNLTITPATSFTNSLGLVTTKVNAGNVPTSVRVTASVTTASNQVIQTQSDLLSVNTGMADQDSFSIATELLNPEAANVDGVEVMITGRLADAFNNPVPDGTTISFTTEGGNIVPSCNTKAGACSVKWTSSEPRVPDHRITILATAVGHETFNDTNGNNLFDNADGVGTFNNAESGFNRVLAAANGFFDMSEAWRDDNEDRDHDAGEKFIDFNNNQTFDARDNLFNGPQCSGILCATGSNKSIHVRRATVMVMSSGAARLTLMSASRIGSLNTTLPQIGNSYVWATNDSLNNVHPDGTTLIVPEGGAEGFVLTFADLGLPYGQILPAGTTVQVTAEGGALTGITSYTVGNSAGSSNPLAYSGDEISFTLTNTNTLAVPAEAPINGGLKVVVTSPAGVVTSLTFNYVLSGT